MELAVAYDLPHLTSLERSFAFTDQAVTLTDTFVLTRETAVTERFVSLIEPVRQGERLLIDDVTVTGPSGITPTVTVKVVWPHIGKEPHNVYLIDYTLPEGARRFTLTMETP